MLVPRGALDRRRPTLLYVAGVGGSGRETAEWAPHLGDVAVVTAVRRRPPTLEQEPTLEARAAALAAQLLMQPLPRELVVVGHSLGAIVGYELVEILERDAPGTVASLVVSGQLPPHRIVYRGAAGVTGIAVLRRMRDNAALPPEVEEAPDLLESFLPHWQAELRALEAYRRLTPHRLATKLHVWTGRDDVMTQDAEAMSRWADCAQEPPAFRTFPGRHDFLFRAESGVPQALAELFS